MNVMYVPINRVFKLDCLSWLKNTESVPVDVERIVSQRPQRRASIAVVQNLFAVGSAIVETGFDHLQRIPRGLSNTQDTVNDTNEEVQRVETVDEFDIIIPEVQPDAAVELNVDDDDIINLTKLFAEAPFEDEEDDFSAELNEMFSGPIKGKKTVAQAESVISPAAKQTSHITTDMATSLQKTDALAAVESTSASTSAILAPPMTLQNDFDPFRRLKSFAFSLNGRPRSLSLDAQPNAMPIRRPVRRNSVLFVPKLEPIVEEILEFGYEIEEIFK